MLPWIELVHFGLEWKISLQLWNMQQQMTTYPMDGQLCVKVASVDLLLCVFYDTIVDHKYRNWTSWLNPKIYHCHLRYGFWESSKFVFGYWCDVKMKIVLLRKAGHLSHKDFINPQDNTGIIHCSPQFFQYYSFTFYLLDFASRFYEVFYTAL